MYYSIRTFSVALIIGLATTLSACGGEDESTTPEAESFAACSTAGQNDWVYHNLSEWYYWNDTLPANFDPEAYADPMAALDALRAPQDRYSFIEDAATLEAFFEGGAYVGFGFSAGVEPEGNNYVYAIAQVFVGSPADAAGLVRGDRITAIDGTSVTSLVNSNTMADALASASITFTVRKIADGSSVDVAVTEAEVAIPPVSDTTVIDLGAGGKVGYLNFRDFTEPAYAALEQAFAAFAAQNVTVLVVDLRYNGGGILDAADYLASLIQIGLTKDEVFAELTYNANKQNYNIPYYFTDPNGYQNSASYAGPAGEALTQPSLNLTKVVFITSGGTASASEAVINGLQPFVLQIALVGDTTYGKPVGMNPFKFCDSYLVAINFETVNADGVGDYFNGMPADCPATDDIDHPLGDQDEASLKEALYWIENGGCSPGSSKAHQTLAYKRAVLPRDEQYDFHDLINAR